MKTHHEQLRKYGSPKRRLDHKAGKEEFLKDIKKSKRKRVRNPIPIFIWKPFILEPLPIRNTVKWLTSD